MMKYVVVSVMISAMYVQWVTEICVHDTQWRKEEGSEVDADCTGLKDIEASCGCLSLLSV